MHKHVTIVKNKKSSFNRIKSSLVDGKTDLLIKDGEGERSVITISGEKKQNNYPLFIHPIYKPRMYELF